jgi:uncharacterized protein YkwD
MRLLAFLLTLLAAWPALAGGGDLDGLLAELNAARSAAGVPPLESDPTLTRISRDYALVMAARDCLAHDCDGGGAGDRARAAGYAYLMIGEALAGGPPDPAGAMALWLGSPTHRDILLNPELSSVGLGYAFQAADRGRAPFGHYWVVTVGLPQ